MKNVRIDIPSKLLLKAFFVILYFFSLNLDELLLSFRLYLQRKSPVQGTRRLVETLYAVLSVLSESLRDNVGNEMLGCWEVSRWVEG